MKLQITGYKLQIARLKDFKINTFLVNGVLLLFIYLTSCQNISNSNHIVEGNNSLTHLIDSLISQGIGYRAINKDSSVSSLQTALEISTKNKLLEKAGYIHNSLGVTYNSAGMYELAILHFTKAISIRREGTDKKSLSLSYNNLGLAYERLGLYKEATDAIFQSKEIAEQNNFYSNIGTNNMALGSILYKQENHTNALKYFKEAEKIFTQNNDSINLSQCYNDIASIYAELGQDSKQYDYLKKSLQIREALKDNRGTLQTLSNLTNFYIKKDSIEQAIKTNQKCITVAEKIQEPYALVISLIQTGQIFKRKNQLHQALIFFEKALRLSQQYSIKDLEQECLVLLADYYKNISNYKEAYGYLNAYLKQKEQFFKEDIKSKIIEIEAKNEIEKQDLAIKELELVNQRNIIFISLLLLIIILIVFITRTLINKNKKIKKANQIIKQKNKDIVSSIQYAKKIQHATLPSLVSIPPLLSDSFILYLPKDIVSGDFYWHTHTEEGDIIAAVDCTGHGVPGAFMSLIGSQALSKIIKEYSISDPGRLLEKLDQEISLILNQSSEETESKDGMDLTICILNKNKKLSYAGANRPLYYITDNTFYEIKATKRPIGGNQLLHKNPFVFHQIQMRPGDKFYLFSDGYADQIGYSTDKKFMTKNLKKLIEQIHYLPMSHQKSKLIDTFINWKGKAEQTDDILFIGVQVP